LRIVSWIVLVAALPALAAGKPAPSFRLSGLTPQGELPLLDMPAVDVEALLERDAQADPYLKVLQIGEPLKADVEPARFGQWEDLPDGDRLWRARLRSRDALWIKLGFGAFRLAEGAELFVYGDDRSTVLGPFTHDDVKWHGQLWLDPIGGDTLVVELRWPGARADEDPNIHLGTVLHGYLPFGDLGRKHHTGNDGSSGSCNIDVNCPLGDAWQGQKRSVVNLLNGGGQYCTGSLVTNTDADCRNYVLTAAHCSSSQSGAASTTFQFNYERPGCASGNAPTDHTVTGSQLRATYGPSDMTLFEMDNDPLQEWDAYYAGWSRETTAPTECTGVHHPSGDVKKVSHNSDPLIDGSNWGPDHWRITEWEQGTTEGGSSGSPIYDQNQRVVGQLHGGQASCTNITWDEYGKLDVSWNGGGTPSSRLSDWLDPGNTGAVTTDGINWVECQTPQPRLQYDSHTIDDSQGNGDGVADPGETFVIRVAERNAGTLDATGVGGTLTTATPLVTVNDGGAGWPDILQQDVQTSASPHFTVTLDPAFVCGDSVDFDLSMSAAEQPGSWAQTFRLSTGTANVSTSFVDDMEAGPNGWTQQTLSGSNPWSQSSADSNSPPTSWFVADVATVTDSVLLMPLQAGLPSDSELSFWHRVNSESGFDGGVLEYTTDGGTNWVDAGPLLVSGGYNSTISTSYSSPIGGRQAWSGDTGGWVEVRADLSSLSGRDVQLRWRFATDSSVSDEGWYVDDVTIESTSFSCGAVVEFPGEASANHSFTIDKDPGGFLLSWDVPVTGGAPDGYKLYRTGLGGGGSFAPTCEADLGTGTSAVLSSLVDNHGFVVVARNGLGDGSFGQDSAGTERPKAAGADVCP
jgi:hypothetical protein